MIKTLSLIKRRPDTSRRAFRDHYESTHAPLALPLMSGLERYVRYHLEEALTGDENGDVGFDVLTAFWYRDAEATSALMEALAGEAGAAIRADELDFMDKPRNTFFPVSERVLIDGEERDEALFVLVGKPASLSRYDCAAQLVDEHFPKLLEGFGAAGGVDYALLRDAFPMEGGSLRYNAVLQICGGSDAGFEAWRSMMEFTGYEITAVRTLRFETDRADIPN